MQHHRSLSLNTFRLFRHRGLSSLKKFNDVSVESEPYFKETLQFVSSDAKANIEYPPIIHFASSPFLPIIKDCMSNQGFETPTSIQSRSWPIALKRRDIISVARTGSGKTFGFLLPAFQKLLIAKELEMIETKQDNLWPKRNQIPTVLVLAPTRELALQIEAEAKKFHSCGLSIMCVYGGAPRKNQAMRIDAGVDIVIATPGRCADLANSGLLDLSKVTYLVLDEADSMMDMGFEHQIRQVVNQLPTARQSLFFSATWPVGVQSLASEFLKDPIQVNLGEIDVPNANKSIKQRIIVMQESDKENSLINLLSNLETNFVSGAKMVPKIIIFVARKNECDVLKKKICKLGYDADALHGDKTQAEREKNLEIFRRGKGKILIATDVASRGLDVKDIDIVINYDFPLGSVAVESYVHRIGRTARGERTGTAYTFFTQKSSLHVNKMCELLDRSEQPIPSALRDMMSGSNFKNIHENRIESTDENEYENGHENIHDYNSENMNENLREFSLSKISDYDNNDKLKSNSSTYDDYDALKMISPRNYDEMYDDDHIDNASQEDIIKTEELKKKKILKKSSIHGVFLKERISKKGTAKRMIGRKDSGQYDSSPKSCREGGREAFDPKTKIPDFKKPDVDYEGF